jgi:hypothetical protein
MAPWGENVEVPFDAVWWWTRPDGVLLIQLASRLTKQPELLEPYGVRSPLWANHTVVLNPKVPRTDEVVGSPQASRFVAILGAVWLLMGQPGVADTRVIAEGPEPRRRRPSADAVPRPEPAGVTIIELRRPIAEVRSETSGKSGRQYQGRWLVGWPNGFWRQQACGPGHSQRKPKWIAPYVAGPEDAPLITKEKVHVWRR